MEIEVDGIRWKFERGFAVAVSLTCADFLRHAAAIWREQPVTGVSLTDKRPEDDRGFMWFSVGQGEDATDLYHATLPTVIWDHLPGRVLTDWGEDYKGFPTEADANAAASLACVQLGKARARNEIGPRQPKSSRAGGSM